MYYKLYRNRLPPYFDNFILACGKALHNLRDRCIHLPDIRCEFGKINAKFQMHVILRELTTPGNPPIYPMIDINEVILSKSLTYYSNFIKSKFTASIVILGGCVTARTLCIICVVP